MSETAEKESKVAKKRPAKKAATKAAKKTPRKAAKKAAKPATERKAAKKTARKAAKKATGRRGRPPGSKNAASGNGRRKRAAKQFAYLLQTTGEDGAVKSGTINGPFATEKDAVDDASIMADDTTTIVVFRETKRGKVQKSTKFVAGR